MTRSRLIGYALFSALLVVAYLTYTSPGKVAVDASGNPVGVVNQLRATLQAERFWSGQLAAVDAEIRRIAAAPERRQQLNADLDTTESQLYAKYPDLAPAGAERLRERADQMEAEAFEQMVQRAEAQRIADLLQIRAVLSRR